MTSLALFLLGFFAIAPETYSAPAPQTATLLATATIPAALTLNVTIIDQLTQAVVPTMDFGELERVGDEFRSKKYFKVLLEVDTVGSPLDLTAIGSPLTRSGGSETMPNGAYIIQPTYSETDNGGKPQPSAAHLSPSGSVVGTNDIYSDTSGSKRFISVFFYLSGDSTIGATQVIPLDQMSGAYSGTVQFTLTAG